MCIFFAVSEARVQVPEILDEEGKPVFGEDYTFELGKAWAIRFLAAWGADFLSGTVRRGGAVLLF